MTAPTTLGRVGALSASDAARAALRTLLLERLEGYVPGDSKAADTPVRLRQVFRQFPTKSDGFQPPCASVTEISSTSDDFDDDFDEDAYDDTTEQAPRMTESSGELSLDLWGATPAERQALKAALPALFRLSGERMRTRGGSSVLVELPDDALPPTFRGRADFRPVVRFTISDPARDIDDSLSAERHEWRATARITWDAQVVTADDVERMDVLTQAGGVVDTGELSSTTSEG